QIIRIRCNPQHAILCRTPHNGHKGDKGHCENRNVAAFVSFVPVVRGDLHGSENTYSIPPLLVCWGRSFMALANPSAAAGSRTSRSLETTAPAQPPTPESTATYCLPSGPRNVVGLPMIPEGVLNFHSSVPVLASTALSQPSIVP